MVQLLVRGVPVEFPFDPYPCQVDYMDKVIESLSTGNNALLESPTGTGKTLCLLCATLAWQTQEKKLKPSKISIGYNLPSQPNVTISGSNSKIIIYASRTHSQLSQVISELRRTGYTPKMTIMASREQLCINDRISRSLHGGALNHACSKLSAQRSCMFKNNLENYSGGAEGAGSGSPILDIEGLVSLGRQDAICPYFFSRDNATKSELILLPYNYLIDSSIRSTLRGVDWQDACIIIDEAHNLEQIASDSSSFSLTTADIAACINELQSVIRLLQIQNATLSSNEAEGNKSTKNGADGTVPGNRVGVYGEKPNLQQCAIILRSLFNLEDKITKLEIVNHQSGPVNLTDGSKCLVLPGSWFISTLEDIGLPFVNGIRTINELKLSADFLMDDLNLALGGARTGAIQEPKLSSLAQCLAKVYKGRDMADCIRQTTDYSVFIKEESGKLGKGKRVINYWCFSPGVAMEELKRLGVRSIILTSGTLSPMEAFREDLKIPFNIVLENPHVIGPNQVWISVVGSGPNGKLLNSSYERRDTVEYKDELGMSILIICRSMKGLPVQRQSNQTNLNLVGGILVFFPTYGTMESAVTRWRANGLWEQLCLAAGHIVMENKGSEKSTASTTKYSSSSTSNYSSSETTSFLPKNVPQQMNTIDEFESAIQRRGSCMLLAVCRGKVSEGIDFRDSKGRIVIITGIPYAPHLDPWIVLKKQHLDDAIQPKGPLETTELSPQVQALRMLSGTSSSSYSNPVSSKSKLSGQGWYVQSASRAVNQAMGRVIRHQKDWGLIFLLDSRFSTDKQTSQLSRWLRPRLKKFSFHLAMQSFREFSAAALTNPELQPTPRQDRIVVRESRIVPDHLRESQTGTGKSTKEVVIDSTLLENQDGDGMDGYINPTLLISQNSFNNSSSNRNNKITNKNHSTGLKLNMSSPHISRQYENHSSENDVSMILSQVKSISATTNLQSQPYTTTLLHKRSIAEVFSKSSSDITPSTKSLSKLSNPSHSLLLKSETTLSAKLREKAAAAATSARVSMTPTIKSESSKMIGLQSSDSYSFSQNDLITSVGNESTQQSSQLGIRSFLSQEFSQQPSSQTSQMSQNPPTSQTSNETKPSKSKKEIFKKLVEHLQTILNDNSFKLLMIEIKKIAAISRENGGIHEVGQIRQFINDLMRVLSPELTPAQLHQSMEIFGNLIPDNHSQLYNTIVDKAIQFHTAQRKTSKQSIPPPPPPPPPHSTTSESVRPPIARGLMSSPIKLHSSGSISGSFGSGSNSDLAQESRASKRAKMLQTSATQQVHSSSSLSSTSSSSLTSNTKLLLSNVDGINLTRQSQNSGNESKQLKRLACIICQENPPRNASVSPCGHICCQKCWEDWLRVKLECPMCRVRTTVSDIARIRVA